jgi:hypothetical protein
MTSMSLPDVLDVPTMKKTFKIQIGVRDIITNKAFTKTIFFGDIDDYVFTKDRNARLKKLNSLKNLKNILHPDYWRAQICYSGDDWVENTIRLARHFLTQKSSLFRHLKPKNIQTPNNHIKKLKLITKNASR